jgi:acetyl esterase/lipase
MRSRGVARVASVVLALVLADACGTAPAPPRPTTDGLVVTVEYAPGLTEDLLLPKGVTKAPLVVMVPGGGWTTADPAGFAALASRLADAGIVVAPTHVRAAADGVVYPVPVEDVLCAVAAAAAEARRRGVVADPVVVLGHSSGAQLAALAVLAAEEHAPTCGSPPVEPDALIGLSGPYDISRLPDVATALLGCAPDDCPDAWQRANPVARASLRPDLPVLLLHGAEDATVPVSFTTQFATALEEAGHPTTVDVVAGADHERIYRPEVAGPRVVRWLHDLSVRPGVSPSPQ